MGGIGAGRLPRIDREHIFNAYKAGPWFMALDPDCQNFYLSEFDHSMLLKYPIRPDGTPGSPVVLLDSYMDDLSQAGKVKTNCRWGKASKSRSFMYSEKRRIQATPWE